MVKYFSDYSQPVYFIRIILLPRDLYVTEYPLAVGRCIIDAVRVSAIVQAPYGIYARYCVSNLIS